MRRLVRRIIAPLVRWAAWDCKFSVWTCRGPSGAHLCLLDAFGVVYQQPVNLTQARQLADDLLDDAYNAAENLPLPPRDL